LYFSQTTGPGESTFLGGALKCMYGSEVPHIPQERIRETLCEPISEDRIVPVE
jgi:hypothetical protein